MGMADTSASARASHEGVGPAILLVDDEAEILSEYQELLELEGFSSIATCNPNDAAALVRAYPSICLIVTDLKMAGIDGARLIDLLRRTFGTRRQLSFIVMTGDASPGATRQLGDVPVILKPIDLDHFITLLRAALTRPAP